MAAILEKYDYNRNEMVIEILGSRFSRGTRNIQGFNTPQVGYSLACSQCDWTRKVNGNLREARPIGRDHARDVHGIRGLQDVEVW